MGAWPVRLGVPLERGQENPVSWMQGNQSYTSTWHVCIPSHSALCLPSVVFLHLSLLPLLNH